MAKVTLDIVDEYPYEIFGISASAKDYRICWSLNQTLEIALKREPSLKIFTKKNEPVEHGYYTFLDEEMDVKFRLVENKRSASKFLPDAPKADYLFIIDESPGIEPHRILTKIRSIRPVLMAFKIDLDQLKNKQNLLLTA